MPKYSFIVPCYDATEKDFRRCLDYIKNQTFKDFEVICIDDCSPIETPKIALEYGYRYIRHNINKHNGGARNTGIREAKGEYLVFCNSDDYFVPETLAEIEKVNKGQDLIIVGFKCFGGGTYGWTPKAEDGFNISKFSWFGEPMHIVRRDLVLENNLFEMENKIVVDVDWTLRLEKCVKTWTFVPKILYMFQTGHETSLSTKIWKGELKSDIKDMLGNNNINIIVYNYSLQKVAGDATFIRNFTKRMSKYYNFNFLYKADCDKNQLSEISKYAKITKDDNLIHICDTMIINSSWGSYPNVTAKRYIFIIHADYEETEKNYNVKFIKPPYENVEYIAVSELARAKFFKMYGIDSKVIYDILDNDVKPEKIFKFIVTGRIVPHKGHERVIKFAQMSKKFNKDFLIFVYGDTNTNYGKQIVEMAKDIPEIIFMPPRLKLFNMLAECTYLLHPSDTESFGYSPAEALQVGTPCITTNYPATYELIKDGVNGYILDFDLFDKGTNEEWENAINKIYNNVPTFEFKELCTEKDWLKELGKPKGKLEEVTPIIFEEPKPFVLTGEFIALQRVKRDNNTWIEKDQEIDGVTNERKLQLLQFNLIRRKE